MLAVSHWNSSFCDNLFLKTEISAMIAVTMHLAIDSTDAGAPADAAGWARARRSPIGDAFLAIREQRKKFRLGGRRNPLKKARSGQENGDYALD
jgi:hypothetical protein